MMQEDTYQNRGGENLPWIRLLKVADLISKLKSISSLDTKCFDLMNPLKSFQFYTVTDRESLID